MEEDVQSTGYRTCVTETKARSWVKSIVWRAFGFVILGAITYLSLTYIPASTKSQTLIVAAFFNLLRFGLYYVHERIGLRIPWGRVERHQMPQSSQ
jgi:hypothetical protein